MNRCHHLSLLHPSLQPTHLPNLLRHLQTPTIVRRMVCQYGMSKELGTIVYGRASSQVFLGRDFHDEKNYSEQTAIKIDTEVRQIVQDCYDETRRLMEENRERLDRLASALMKREVMDAEEIIDAVFPDDRPDWLEVEEDEPPSTGDSNGGGSVNGAPAASPSEDGRTTAPTSEAGAAPATESSSSMESSSMGGTATNGGSASAGPDDESVPASESDSSRRD